MDYDYSELLGKIKKIFKTNAKFAIAMGMGESTLSLKLNNKAEWTQEEMAKAMSLIQEPLADIDLYFFTHSV